jgi:hypothetical protein
MRSFTNITRVIIFNFKLIFFLLFYHLYYVQQVFSLAELN